MPKQQTTEMKKALAAILIFSTLAFSTDNKMTVTGSVEEWGNVMYVIEQSNAPYQQVQAAKKFLLQQLEPQARKLDSLANKKP